VVVAGYGIGRIVINDNPVKWFTPSHPIRVADRVLNEHFGGTYMAYLAMEPGPGTESPSAYADGLLQRLETRGQDALALAMPHAATVFDALRGELAAQAARAQSKEALRTALAGWLDQRAAAAPDAQYEAWNEAQLFLDAERQRDELFKQPEALRYVAGLQAFLKTTGVVGKSNSVADIVKTVHRELLLGEEMRAEQIPPFRAAKAGAGHGSKVHRSSQMLADYERGQIVHVIGTHDALERSLRRFPKSKPLDLADAAYWAWYDLRVGVEEREEVVELGPEFAAAGRSAWDRW